MNSMKAIIAGMNVQQKMRYKNPCPDQIHYQAIYFGVGHGAILVIQRNGIVYARGQGRNARQLSGGCDNF
ncbi:hypothetical protein [Yersinia mollaretii]|uniref:hypothetical protein n=1 Tax=Yersinia mollaretii TaxID=33060 RepID=UPI00066FE296|nr:hypothetical protein [Yersinia mollaretii]